MHDIGDSLAQNQFNDIVTDMEKITVTYHDVMTLMQDLKTIGAHNMNPTRPPHLMGKNKLHTMIQHYEKRWKRTAPRSQKNKLST